MEGFAQWLLSMDFEPFLLILVLIVIDYVLGTIGAMLNDEWSSSKMRRGLVHKFTYIIIIFMALVIERLAYHYDIGLVFTTGFVSLVCVWIIVTELGSILENLVVINPAFADNSFMRIFAKREEIEIAREPAKTEEDENCSME